MYKATSMALDRYDLEHMSVLIKYCLRLQEGLWDVAHAKSVVARIEEFLDETHNDSGFILIEVRNDGDTV